MRTIQVGVVPAKFYERYFEEHTFAMNHHGLGSQGAKALSEALHDNDHITTLVSRFPSQQPLPPLLFPVPLGRLCDVRLS
jgi:hypothetical protein